MKTSWQQLQRVNVIGRDISAEDSGWSTAMTVWDHTNGIVGGMKIRNSCEISTGTTEHTRGNGSVFML